MHVLLLELRHGATPEDTDHQGNTALFHACKRGHKRIAQRLLRNHQEITHKEIDRALISGNAEVVTNVVRAYHHLSGDRVRKKFFLNRARRTHNLKLLVAGLKTEVLQSGDITPLEIRLFATKRLTRPYVQLKVRSILEEAKKRSHKPKHKIQEEKVIFEGPETEKETFGPQCNICFTPLSFRQPKRALLCYDVFHTKCLASWFPLKDTCPLCRRKANVFHNEIGFEIPKDTH